LDRAYAEAGLGEWLPKIKEMLDYGDVDGLIKALYSKEFRDKFEGRRGVIVTFLAKAHAVLALGAIADVKSVETLVTITTGYNFTHTIYEKRCRKLAQVVLGIIGHSTE
jgi:hypothetical protein